MALHCPPDWAMSLTPREAEAWIIAIGIARNGVFDFDNRKWVKNPTPEE